MNNRMENSFGGWGSFAIALLNQTEWHLQSILLLKACSDLPEVDQGKWLRFSALGWIHKQHLSKQIGRRHLSRLQWILNKAFHKGFAEPWAGMGAMVFPGFMKQLLAVWAAYLLIVVRVSSSPDHPTLFEQHQVFPSVQPQYLHSADENLVEKLCILFCLFFLFPPIFDFLHVAWLGGCLACKLSNAALDHGGFWREVPICCPIIPGMKEVGFTDECM